MFKVFVDSPALLAFINRGHPQHSLTVEQFEYLASQNAHLTSSLMIIAQTHAQLLANFGLSIAQDFVRIIPYSAITIIKPTSTDEVSAYQLLKSPQNYQANLQDALHVAIIRRAGVTHALSQNPFFPQNNIELIGS